VTQGARVTLARRLLSYLSAEAEPSLRFLLLVKLVSKEKDNLRNRKSPLSLILTALATLMVMASVILTASSAQAARGHNNKVVKTTINIRTSTKIGNTTLAPGKYRVKITPASDASGDPTVQFSILHNPYGNDFSPPYDEVVVLTVQASMMDLRAPTAGTELILTSCDNNKATALEIRGNSTEYVFGAKIAAAANNH